MNRKQKWATSSHHRLAAAMISHLGEVLEVARTGDISTKLVISSRIEELSADLVWPATDILSKSKKQ